MILVSKNEIYINIFQCSSFQGAMVVHQWQVYIPVTQSVICLFSLNSKVITCGQETHTEIFIMNFQGLCQFQGGYCTWIVEINFRNTFFQLLGWKKSS